MFLQPLTETAQILMGQQLQKVPPVAVVLWLAVQMVPADSKKSPDIDDIRLCLWCVLMQACMSRKRLLTCGAAPAALRLCWRGCSPSEALLRHCQPL